MPIRIGLPSRKQLSFESDRIVIGRAGDCDVKVVGEDIHPHHATIRKMAGRWVVESLGEWFIQVGNTDAGKTSWLTLGDPIQLSPTGPTIVFGPEAPQWDAELSETEQWSPENWVEDELPASGDAQPSLPTPPTVQQPMLPPKLDLWHYSLLGEIKEPVPFVVLKKFVEIGQVAHDDLVCQDGTDHWQPANSVNGLLPRHLLPRSTNDSANESEPEAFADSALFDFFRKPRFGLRYFGLWCCVGVCFAVSLLFWAAWKMK